MSALGTRVDNPEILPYIDGRHRGMNKGIVQGLFVRWMGRLLRLRGAGELR
jgi:hypothetical protein